MRTREELYWEVKDRDTETGKESTEHDQLHELALDQRDLLVEIRELLNQMPRPYQPWVPPYTPAYPLTTVTNSPDSTTLKDSQSLG